MKNQVSQSAPDAFAALNQPASKNLLRHVLSPLEKAVFAQTSKAYKSALEETPPNDFTPIYKPFNYKLEGIPIYVSRSASR